MARTLPIRTTAGCTRPRTAGGFTLLELLIVMGLLSVLTGMAVGVLGRRDPQMIAASVIGGACRAAQVTARSQGVPTEVWVRPGVDNQAASVQTLLLRPVAVFGFEPGQSSYDEALVPMIAGEDVPGGRFGHARSSGGSTKSALLRWPVTPAVMDLRDGFVCRLDLFLTSRTRATILKLPPAIELIVDEDLLPTMRLRLRADGGPSLAAVVSDVPLPLQRWCTVDVCCNGRLAWLQVDGREVANAPVAGSPLQEPDGVFEIGPAETPLPGIVDEVRWFVYEMGPPQTLPIELQPTRTFHFTYDLHGAPVAAPEVTYVPLEGDK